MITKYYIKRFLVENTLMLILNLLGNCLHMHKGQCTVTMICDRYSDFYIYFCIGISQGYAMLKRYQEELPGVV